MIEKILLIGLVTSLFAMPFVAIINISFNFSYKTQKILDKILSFIVIILLLNTYLFFLTVIFFD